MYYTEGTNDYETVDENTQDNKEYNSVLNNLIHIEELVSQYFDFIDELWNDEIIDFSTTNDCYIYINDTVKNKTKFTNLMLDTPYYKQLITSKYNFEKRLERLF